jgi:copper(I)-binding protein
VTRSMTRSTVLALSMGLLSAGLLAAVSACGAGQVTQTETQLPPISGVNVDSADRTIALRDVAIEYKDPAGYPAGSVAPLRLHVVNQSRQAVRLVGVTTDLGQVVVAGPSAAPLPPSPSPSVPPSGSPSVSPSNGRSASPSPSVSASAPASSPAASPSASAPAGNPQINIEVPPTGLVALKPGQPRYLQIAGLARSIRSGDIIEVTFRFDNGVSIPVKLPIATPMSPLPRSPMEIPEEGSGH